TVVWEVKPGTATDHFGHQACDRAEIKSLSENDPITGNNFVLRCVSVQPALHDLSVVKTATPTVPAGSDLTYTITVANSGPSEVTSTTVTDTLDSSLDPLGFGPALGFKSVDAPGWDGGCSNAL